MLQLKMEEGTTAKKKLFASSGNSSNDLHFEVNVEACNNLSPPKTPGSVGSGENPGCITSPLSSVDDELDLGEFIYERHSSFDEKLFELRRQSTDQLAAQITLMDLDAFKRIELKEFHNGNWMKKDKTKLAPNVLHFTRKFNHNCFWVEREILEERNLKLRSELLAFFVKLSKKLFDLNNLHGMMAILSALQSAAIFRLTLTWKGLSKRDRSTFDKLAELTSTDDNHCRLREHLRTHSSPCIPHLGLYLTDMAFLLAKQESSPSPETQAQDFCLGSVDLEPGRKSITAIFDTIVSHQNSVYDHLAPNRYIQRYLSNIDFIDELEKFIVKDFFEKSQKLEPDEPAINFRPSKSTDELGSPTSVRRVGSPEESKQGIFFALGVDKFMRRNNSWSNKAVRSPKHSRSASTSPTCSDSIDPCDKPEVAIYVIDSSPTQKRSIRNRALSPLTTRGRSVSTALEDQNGLDSSLPVPLSVKSQSSHSPSAQRKRPFGLTRGHRKASSLGTNVLQSMGITATKTQTKVPSEQENGTSMKKTVSLLDDSYLDLLTSPGASGSESEEEEDEYELWSSFVRLSESDVAKWRESGVLKEGGLKRQVCKLNGKAVPKTYQKKIKCTTQLTPSGLILIEKKRSKIKWQTNSPQPDLMGLPLDEGMLACLAGKSSDKTFVITDDNGFMVNFTAGSSQEATSWVERLRDSIHEFTRRKQETSLIKL